MPRKPYAKGRESQEKILDMALTTIAQKGYNSTSLADIAKATGMTSAGLLHHFGSKENLHVEVLRRRDVVDTQWLPSPGEGEVPTALRLARYNQTVPGLIKLYVNVEADASDPNHPGHEYFRERYMLVSHRVGRDIEIRQRQQRFDPGVDSSQIAGMLVALSDGLQARWALDPSSVDMMGVMLSFWNYFVPRNLTVEDVNRSVEAMVVARGDE